jgi:hypothetical protein
MELIKNTCLIGALIGLYAYGIIARDRERKKEDRRCTCPRNADGSGGPCGSYTFRHYRMVPDDSRPHSRWGVWFHWYVLDECEAHGHVKLVKGGPDETKFFDSLKIASRRLSDPAQFSNGDDLFVRAGILAVVTEPHAERVRRAMDEARARAGRLKARLDGPPEVTLVNSSVARKSHRPILLRPSKHPSAHRLF